MTTDQQPSDAGALSFAAGLAVARARQGLLTVPEIRAALDEAYRMGQQSIAAPVPPEGWEQRVEAAARAMAASDAACEAAPEWHEMSDHLQDNWIRRAAAALTADAALAGQHTTEEGGR